MEAKKIRVCFVSPKAYPLFNPDYKEVFGGAEVDLYLLATELAKDPAYDVRFVVADYGQPQTEQREGVTLIKSLDFNQNPVTGALKIWRALKQADADIYMMKTASPGVPLVQRFCQKYQRRFVYRTAHQRECDGTYVKQHPILGRLFVHSLKKAEIVFAQNTSDAESLASLHKIAAVTIPNGHRISEGTGRERKWILWVGRSAGFKHSEYFLELTRAFPQEQFVMICQRATGDGNYGALCEEARKIENLEFIERVPFGDVDRYFEQAKIYVNTSDSEGFANTFIQACKAGTAILSYRVNPDGFLDDYHCGVCCHGDQTVMADQLRTMLENDRYPELGRNGRKYVAEKHDIAVIVEKYKVIFTQLLS